MASTSVATPVVALPMAESRTPKAAVTLKEVAALFRRAGAANATFVTRGENGRRILSLRVILRVGQVHIKVDPEKEGVQGSLPFSMAMRYKNGQSITPNNETPEISAYFDSMDIIATFERYVQELISTLPPKARGRATADEFADILNMAMTFALAEARRR